MRTNVKAALFLLPLILTACQELPDLPFLPENGATAQPTAVVTTAVPVQTSAADTPTPQETQEQSGSVTLKIWLPSQFDPGADTPAGSLLSARLEEFQTSNPNVNIEVRLKAIEGTGGLLDSLTTANAAAPLALPDLVVLPRPLLESAALIGLVYPYDGLTTAMDDHEWFEYARQLSRLQNSIYGLPFAGDALMMAHRPLLDEPPPRDWEMTTTISGTLAFAAADPQALFTLLQYQAAGGVVQNEQGQPLLEAEILAAVLTFFQTAEQAGVMPFWLTQLENFDQVWESFSGRQSSMAVSWYSNYLKQLEELPVQAQGAVLPTSDGRPYTLANGWVWALASPKPDRHELSARLAEFLVEDTFLGAWTSAAGLLPPHSGALANWQNTELRNLANQIQTSAHLFPSIELLDRLGPILEQATADVLKEQSDPLSAAQSALENLENP